MAGWHTIDSARDQAEWATEVPDHVLTVLLEVARQQVTAYAPRLPLLTPTPENLALAQLRQAQNLWRADSVNTTGDMSEGEFSYTPHPLDWHIKQLIRPRRGRPTVG